MPQDFISQANSIRRLYIEDVNNYERWQLARQLLRNRIQTLQDERARLLQQGIHPLGSNVKGSVLTFIDQEIQISTHQFRANTQHLSLFTNSPDHSLQIAKEHLGSNQEAYFDYAVALATAAGVSIYVDGQQQRTSRERFDELSGYHDGPNPYGSNLPRPL